MVLKSYREDEVVAGTQQGKEALGEIGSAFASEIASMSIVHTHVRDMDNACFAANSGGGSLPSIIV